jgi:hypothetical protein
MPRVKHDRHAELRLPARACRIRQVSAGAERLRAARSRDAGTAGVPLVGHRGIRPRRIDSAPRPNTGCGWMACQRALATTPSMGAGSCARANDTTPGSHGCWRHIGRDRPSASACALDVGYNLKCRALPSVTNENRSGALQHEHQPGSAMRPLSVIARTICMVFAWPVFWKIQTAGWSFSSKSRPAPCSVSVQGPSCACSVT